MIEKFHNVHVERLTFSCISYLRALRASEKPPNIFAFLLGSNIEKGRLKVHLSFGLTTIENLIHSKQDFRQNSVRTATCTFWLYPEISDFIAEEVLTMLL